MTAFAQTYAEGLFALTQEEKLSDQIERELEQLSEILKKECDFMRLLQNLSIAVSERKQMLETVFSGQIHPYLLNFLRILCDRNALDEFEDCKKAFIALYRRENNMIEARVTTAVPLSETQREAVIRKAAQLSGKKIVLCERVEAGLIGGVVLEMEGKKYDNSLKSRLETLYTAIRGET